MNIKESMSQYLSFAGSTRAASTARTYRNALNVFSAHLASMHVLPTADTTLFTIIHFTGFPAYLYQRGMTRATTGAYMSGVKGYYEWLIRNDLIAAPNYADTLKMQYSYREAMRKRENKLVRFPKRGEAEKMVDTVSDMNYPSPRLERNIALVRFLYSSGCRNAEVARLLIKDLDLDERSAIVLGKGSKERRVYFDKETAQALRHYWNTRGWFGPNDPVFARHDRGAGKKHIVITTRTVDHVVADICAAAGIEPGKFTPHYFRHAFAITVLRETGNLAMVQDLLGHKSANSTRVYAKIYPDELRDAHHRIYS